MLQIPGGSVHSGILKDNTTDVVESTRSGAQEIRKPRSLKDTYPYVRSPVLANSREPGCVEVVQSHIKGNVGTSKESPIMINTTKTVDMMTACLERKPTPWINAEPRQSDVTKPEQSKARMYTLGITKAGSGTVMAKKVSCGSVNERTSLGTSVGSRYDHNMQGSEKSGLKTPKASKSCLGIPGSHTSGYSRSQ